MVVQNRREFGKSIAATTAAFLAGQTVVNGADKTVDAVTKPTLPVTSLSEIPGWKGRSNAKHVRTAGRLTPDGEILQETARNIPVVEESDVIVCGGGPAGVAAALAAARSGAKTRLLEVNGCVGGVWTAGALSLIIGIKEKTGIMAELYQKVIANGTRMRGSNAIVYDPEFIKLTLEQMLLKAGVKIQLHTRVVGAINDQHNRLSAVLTESKSGRQAWSAKTFIDCSGDGDLAAQAGCSFDLGRPDNGVTQPMSLMTLLTGITTDDVAPFIQSAAGPRKLGNAKKNLLAELRKAGVEPSYAGPTLFEIRNGMYAMMANHQYGVLAIDAEHVTDATLEARAEIHKLINALKKMGGRWKDLKIAATAEQIGTRGGRRIRGLYRVNSDDLRKGSRFEDGICRVNFGIDVHSTNPKATKEIEQKPFKSKPYDIPLRALIARDVTGLMMAGRCISGDFIAHSSYRVTGNSVAMGEAAGVTAALAASHKTLPHQIPFKEVHKGLNKIRKATS